MAITSLLILLFAAAASPAAVPTAAREAYDQALDCLNREDYEAAKADLRRAVEAAPDWVEALNTLGMVLDRTGEGTESVKVFRHAIDLAPEDASLHNNLGLALGRLGKNEESIAAHERALAIRPDDAQMLRNLGNAYKRAGRYEKARETFLAAVKASPEDPELPFAVGTACLLLARDLPADKGPARKTCWEEAARAFGEAISRRPAFVEALNNRGTAYRLLERMDEARADYEKSLSVDPEQVQPHFDLALICEAQGDDGAALIEWNLFVHKALLDPETWQVHLSTAKGHLEGIKARRANGSTDKGGKR